MVSAIRYVSETTHAGRRFTIEEDSSAGFYLAFTAYLGDEGAWCFESVGVIAFAVLGLLGVPVPVALIIGYVLHGFWDLLHEI
jgi:hypothetical protein